MFLLLMYWWSPGSFWAWIIVIVVLPIIYFWDTGISMFSKKVPKKQEKNDNIGRNFTDIT